jgi:type III secretion protein L
LSFATLILKDRVAVNIGAVILAPNEVQSVMSAQALVDSCEKFCTTERLAAEEHRRVQESLGYEDGLARAGAEYAHKLAQTESEIAEFWAAQQDRVFEVITSVLQKLAPALNAKALIRELVAKAVQEVREERWLVVRVHPDNLGATRDALKELQAQNPHIVKIEARENVDLGLNDCIIESPNGFVNASWAVQVKALHQVFRSFSAASMQEHPATKKLSTKRTATSAAAAMDRQ